MKCLPALFAMLLPAKDNKAGQTYRVLRGASWGTCSCKGMSSSFRGHVDPLARRDHYGFRCVLAVAGG